ALEREGVVAVPAGGGGSSVDRDADPVVGVDQEGELPDVIDGVLGAEPALLSTGDGVVDRLTGVGVEDEVARTVHPRLLVGPLVAVALRGVLGAGKEPQPVLDDVPAQGGAEVVDVVELAGAEDHRLPAGGGQRTRGPGQGAGGPGSGDRAVELLGARLGWCTQGS